MTESLNKSECFGVINKYILLGGGLLLVFTAKRLIELDIQILVVTSERHLKERLVIDSKEITFLDWLNSTKIKYFSSQEITTDSRVLNAISDTTIGLSFGAAWIFEQEFIDRFDGNLLNLHGSKLPKNRGGGGFSWRILQGDMTGMSLIHRVDSGIDTGDIVLFDEYVFPEDCRVPLDYQEYSISQYRELLDAFFSKVQNSELFEIRAQQDELSSYWPRLSSDIHGFVDWSWKLVDIERFICAFDSPYGGASTFINGHKVRIKGCQLWLDDGDFHPFQQGVIYRKNGTHVFIATRHGSLIVDCVLDEQGKDMKECLHAGDRFYTPQKFIDKSMQYRAIYTPTGLKHS